MLLKPHLTSTPRRPKQPSTNIIPLKRLLYNNTKDPIRVRHSSKRSIFPRYNPLDPMHQNPQWI